MKANLTSEEWDVYAYVLKQGSVPVANLAQSILPKGSKNHTRITRAAKNLERLGLLRKQKRQDEPLSWVPNENHPAAQAMPQSARKNATLLSEAFKSHRKPTTQQAKIINDVIQGVMANQDKVNKDIFADTKLYKETMSRWFLGRAESLGDLERMKAEIQEILEEL